MFLSELKKYFILSSILSCAVCQSDANFQTFTVSDETIEIDQCESAVILPVSSLIQRVSNLGASVGDPCFTTQTFIDRCEARTNCEFINSEYRTEVEDSCESEVGTTEQLVFVYTCLPISDMKSIDGLNENVDIVYLRSPNYPDNTEVSDVNEVCVMNPVGQDTFRLLELESTTFLETTSSGTPELTLQSQVALQSEGLRHDLPNNNQPKQSINYTDFIGVDLESLNITYVQSAKNLKFLMKFNATSQFRICCTEVNETHPWQPCDPVIIPPPSVTQRTKKGPSDASMTWVIYVVIALGVCAVTGIVIAAVIFIRRRKGSHGSSTSYCNYLCGFCTEKCAYKKASTGEGNDSPRDHNKPDTPDILKNNNHGSVPIGQSAFGTDVRMSTFDDDNDYSRIGSVVHEPKKTAPKPKPRTLPRNTKPVAQPATTDTMPVYAVPEKPKKTPSVQSHGDPAAPNKPPRLNQGIVEEQKSKLINRSLLDANSHVSQRKSATQWEPNPIYGQA